MDTARFKSPPFWVDIDKLFLSVRSLDKDVNKMRGFMMVSKKQSLEDLGQRETSILDIISKSHAPKVRFMSDLSIPQLKRILNILNQEECKILIFKFLNDISMIYGISPSPSPSPDSNCEVHGQYLSNDFFDQINLLRNSCNDFEGIQKKLSSIMH